ncbi:MAG TPA: hypothetical protein VF283_01320 [Bryobacteraceae bacterium]
MRSVLICICICALLFAGAQGIYAQQDATSAKASAQQQGHHRSWPPKTLHAHWHRFAFFKPGAGGDDFPVLIVGQDQVARVVATDTNLHVTVPTRAGQKLIAFNVNRKP